MAGAKHKSKHDSGSIAAGLFIVGIAAVIMASLTHSPSPSPAPVVMPKTTTYATSSMVATSGQTVTVKTATGTASFQLVGIAAPEDTHCGAQNSKRQLQTLINGTKTVAVTELPSDDQPRDSAMPRLAYITAKADNQTVDLGNIQTDLGWSVSAPARGEDPKLIRQIAKSARTARAAQQGLWRACPRKYH